MMEQQSDNLRKIFCGGLHLNTTKEGLQKHFSKYGKISDCVVMKDPTSGRSRGFGFITYEDPASVDKAQKERPHTLDGKQMDTKRAIPKDDPLPENRMVSSKIFVGGLKREVDKKQVEEYFRGFGNVTECILVNDKATGVSRGFGFVTFDDPDTVDKVILHRPHNIQNNKADVKKALSKEEMEQVRMKQQQQQQYYQQQQQGGYYGNEGGDWNQAQGGGYYDQGQGQGWNSGYGDGYGADYSSGYEAAAPAWGSYQQSTTPSRGGFRGGRGGGGAMRGAPRGRGGRGRGSGAPY
jgi:RNA recognition motif-containing protein